jgi:NTE family protein
MEGKPGGLRCDLVLSGPGLTSIVPLIGAVAALREAGFVPSRIAGVSGGAVVGALLASGLDTSALSKIAVSLDFSKFADYKTRVRAAPLRVRTTVRGDYLRGFLGNTLSAQGVRTFGDLMLPDDEVASSERQNGSSRLTVLVQERPRVVRILPRDLPQLGLDPNNVLVAEAVVAAVAGPMFEPWSPDGRVQFSDAITGNPLPVGVLDRIDGRPPRWPTFGIIAEMPYTRDDEPVHPRLSELDQLRSIVIQGVKTAGNDLGLTPDACERMLQQGRSAVGEFLASWDWHAYTTARQASAPPEAPSSGPPLVRVVELPPPTRSLALAGYVSDSVFGPDQLDIADDVQSLCTVLLAERVEPPLSVGLFGDWGSGKSFFMQKMR